MAVVYRFPDRSAAGQERTRVTDGVLQTAEILILPCIRREPIGLRTDGGPLAALPAQLQA